MAPACNDAGQNEPDGEISVLRFKGVPADVAVVSSVDSGFYLVAGSLVAKAHGCIPVCTGPAGATRVADVRGLNVRGHDDADAGSIACDAR